MEPICDLSPLNLNPTPIINIAINAFPLAMISAKDTTTAGSFKLKIVKNTISTQQSNATDFDNAFKIFNGENLPPPFTIDATLYAPPRQIQAFVNTLSKDGANERTGKPLAPKTIRHNLSLISDIFTYAVKMGVVSENPCSKVTIPKGEPTEKKIYTLEEIEKFLMLLNDEPLKYRTFFNLAIYSGFRRGELLGLEWKDVDFENNIIKIRRTSNYTAQQGVYTDTTKTRKSQRTLKFPQEIMDMLKEYKAEQDGQALKYGDKWVETDRLYTKWNGEPMQNGTPYFWLGEFCEKHDLPFYGLHSFRHLFASLLVNNGVDIVTVSGALGHSTVSTTTNVYCHMIEDAQAKASDAVSNALNFNSKKPTPDEESA